MFKHIVAGMLAFLLAGSAWAQQEAGADRAVGHGSNSTFGTYSVSADGKVLVLKIEGGTWPHRNGTEQRRDFTLAGEDMSYSLASSRGGRSTLSWKRVK